MEVYVIVDAQGLRVVYEDQMTPKFTSYIYNVRLKQLNCDKGIDNWNLVMKLTLDQETRYNEFKRL